MVLAGLLARASKAARVQNKSVPRSLHVQTKCHTHKISQSVPDYVGAFFCFLKSAHWQFRLHCQLQHKDWSSFTARTCSNGQAAFSQRFKMLAFENVRGQAAMTVSDSTVSNTELRELSCPHRVAERKLSDLLSVFHLWAKVNSLSCRRTQRVWSKTQ